MKTSPDPDRAAFQEFLADAFTVQESHMDRQSLSAIVEVLQWISSDDLDVNGAMHLIADRARYVANATGVAIGLLKENQLAYRAGSGSAENYPGRTVSATLVVPVGTGSSHEILRVEDAQTSGRTEAAICRQFGSNALLILLICHDRAPAGVLEIHFREAHVFQDREVRTYRLMAGLIAEAISHAAQPAHTKAMAAAMLPVPAIAPITYQMKKVHTDWSSIPDRTGRHAPDQAWHPGRAVAAELPVPAQTQGPATRFRQQMRRSPQHKTGRNAAMAAVVAVLVSACWFAYSDRHSASPLGASLQKSNILGQQAPPLTKPAPSNYRTGPQSAPVSSGEARTPTTAFHRVRVGNNEVDYIGEDVTIRRFTPEPIEPVGGGARHVRIGDDVIVRYFSPNPASVPPTRPVSSAVQPAESSLSGPQKAGSAAVSR